MPHIVSASDQLDCFCVHYASYCECLRSVRLFLCVLCLILWVPQINKTVPMCAMPHTVSDQQDFCMYYASYWECHRSSRLFLCVLCLTLWVTQIFKIISKCAMPHVVSASDQQDLFLCVLCLILWMPQITKTVSVCVTPHTVSASDHQDCFCVSYASYYECLRSPRLFLCVLFFILWVP